MPNFGFSYSHSEVCLPQELNLYRWRMHTAQQLCADAAETEAEDGTPSAGAHLRKCDTSCPPVSQSSEKNVCAVRCDACAFAHSASLSPNQNRPSGVNPKKHSYQVTTLVKLKSNFLCKRSLHKADCLDSILNSLPSFKTQSISVKPDCYHLIKMRMLIGGRSPWWTYQTVSGQVVSAKQSRRRFNQVCTNLSKDRNCR